MAKRSCSCGTAGPTHTRGDQSIFLPEYGILFTGDLVRNRFSLILPFSVPHDIDVDGRLWIGAIRELQQLDTRMVVPGHRPLGDAKLLAITNEYLSWLRSETKQLAGEGNNADAINAKLEPQIRAHYTDWGCVRKGA